MTRQGLNSRPPSWGAMLIGPFRRPTLLQTLMNARLLARLSTSSQDLMASDFWVVTSYFNPKGWEARRRNYSVFRQNLSLPLLTVEWSPEGKFELVPSDADLLVQVSGGDLLWQKERLLNIGISHLPTPCEYVAWIDADVIFEQSDWAASARTQLQEVDVVQLFSEVKHLQPSVHSPEQSSVYLRQSRSIIAAWQETEFSQEFITSLLMERALRTQGLIRRSSSNESPGFAWASRRKWLDATGGLFDGFIIGGGDALLFYTLAGRFGDYLDAYKLNSYCGERLRLWQPKILSKKQAVGYVQGSIFHLFHGFLQNRQYIDRYRMLAESGIDIDLHLVDEPGAPWKLDSNCPLPVRTLMAQYFQSRREDDIDSKS